MQYGFPPYAAPLRELEDGAAIVNAAELGRSVQIPSAVHDKAGEGMGSIVGPIVSESIKYGFGPAATLSRRQHEDVSVVVSTAADRRAIEVTRAVGNEIAPGARPVYALGKAVDNALRPFAARLLQLKDRTLTDGTALKG